jgi:16S rRNA (cytosine1402-N4)-methyltransferase
MIAVAEPSPTFHHLPVLAAEVIAALRPTAGDVLVDCTLGGGGHAGALLRAAECRVIGIDRDPAALSAASVVLSPFGDRFTPVHGKFGDLGAILADLGIGEVQGVLADLGVSSHQLDTAARGFSFRLGGPLDMRMDPTAAGTAADLVNQASEDDLADWIARYGEERHARRVARRIVAGRPWADTGSLASAIAGVVGRGTGRIHPATRTFQALRIAVNDELGEITRLLPAAVEALAPGGRLAVISFHSLEDRIVKQFLATEAGKLSEKDPFGHPIDPVRLRLSPAVSPSESDPNPRARSARLRSAVRLPWNAS